MIVVAIIGVLAALAVYGVGRYLAIAKTSEAKNSIGGVSRFAAHAYEREVLQALILADGTNSAAATHILCATAIPVPQNFAQVQGVKYQPISAANQDFNSGDAITGWQCLGYAKSEPMYYQLQYNANAGYVSVPLGAPDPGASGFEAAAQGDTDADNIRSTFSRNGIVNAATGTIRMATHVFVDQDFE